MSKYISIFFLTIMVVFALYMIFGSIFMAGGNSAEEAVYTVGLIIIILISFLISQTYYLIDLIRKKK
ncbi:hypothetical protein GS18_0210570 [Metabacillus indicus]|uniref:Uncharacterized protein n=1 Tax=Metabacillus indicus TaxID=246786 RepID=A0A084GW60_METID|nr:hypothetical protein GS18_0210570 [Metabacillus indicus]